MTDFSGNNRTALALGNFDGLHAGHLQVLSAVAEQKNNGFCPVLVRFYPHPSTVLHGKTPLRLLTDAHRKQILNEYHAQETVLDFLSVCEMTPERFVEEILIGKLNAGFVACGFNFRFGKNASGTAEDLRRIAEAHGIGCFIASALTFEEDVISATRIRNCIADGDICPANAMLTRPFSYDFEVVGGDRRGRLMGTPTINQYFPADFIVPKYGVYASFVVLDSVLHPAVTNIGLRPTFNGSGERSETWIMDYSGDLYGQHVPVYLLSYLRNEVKFDDMNALRNQILADSQASRDAFEIFQKKLKYFEKKA